MKRFTRTILWSAVLIAPAACTSKPEAPVEGIASVAPTVVPLSSANHAFQAPDTIDAGWITFRFTNNDSDIHYAHIVQLDSGRTVAELLEAYATAIRTSGPRPKWVKRFGGPGGTPPGGTSEITQRLEPGTYVWICPIEDEEGNPHFGVGESKAFVVREPAHASGEATPPVASANVRLLDFTFAVDSQLTAGAHTIRVENAGVEPHDLVMMKLAPGETLDDVRAFMNPEQARRPGEADRPQAPLKSLENGVGGIAAIAPGMQVFFATSLTPGDYVLVCMATAPDGRSHIEHGMIQQITVR